MLTSLRCEGEDDFSTDFPRGRVTGSSVAASPRAPLDTGGWGSYPSTAMPTYEYACSNCGHTWEDFQKISADPAKECPNCHQQTAQRQISGGNFILKGGGWYADLYSSSGGAKKKADAASAEKSGSSGGEKPSTEKSSGGDAKAETKSTAPAATTAPSTGSSGSSGSSGSGSSGKSD
jgi:putative FmdB family regulatory protein